MMDVITYPCWDLSLTMLVKGATGVMRIKLVKGQLKNSCLETRFFSLKYKTKMPRGCT